MLKTVDFGRAGVRIARLGFGAMGLTGWFGDQPETAHIDSLHHAWDRGVNFLDTARGYGDSERIIGAALAEWRGAAPFIATKVSGQQRPLQWGTPTSLDATYPPGHIRADCELSLRTLGVDRIGLLQLHCWWPTWGSEGRWLDELTALKDEGKVQAIGISIPDHRHDIALELVRNQRIDSVQTIVNIFDPHALELLVPACAEAGVAVIARCVFDEGGLTGFLTEDTTFSEGDFRKGYFDTVVPRAAYLSKVAALQQYIPEHASSLAALALRFALQNPSVTTAITSMQVRDHISMNIDALAEGPLPEPVFRKLFLKHRFTKNYNEAKIFGLAEPA